METMYYIGLDVHKRTISYCVKTVASIAAVHGCGKVFIHRSSSKRVAGIVPSKPGRGLPRAFYEVQCNKLDHGREAIHDVEAVCGWDVSLFPAL